jgi:L,D-peptidoglycan transpeptidase YkuD (ErfK/YbiS/YcfS/YnhG family)
MVVLQMHFNPKNCGKTGNRAIVQVLARSDAAASGRLRFGNLQFPAALGKGGVRALKREGDGANPMGFWPAILVFYRPDRLRRPVTALPVTPLRERDGWCDAALDRNYNRKVTLPYPASHEQLWRKDGLYDVIVVLDYNYARRAKGRGSAIFMHVARRGFAPTEGCIALKREHLLRLLAVLPRGAVIAIGRSRRPPRDLSNDHHSPRRVR